MSLPLLFPPTTAPVTKSGDTMLGLAVRKGQLDIIKFLVTECSVSVNGEPSVYVSPAICGVCEHRTLGTTLLMDRYFYLCSQTYSDIVDELIDIHYLYACVVDYLKLKPTPHTHTHTHIDTHSGYIPKHWVNSMHGRVLPVRVYLFCILLPFKFIASSL